MEIPAGNILPVVLLFLSFTLTSFFGGFAEILTRRELLDAIPNRIRNSMYSPSPTIATIFALSQIWFFGWLISTMGFPLTLLLCGLVSLIGVLLIRKGHHQQRPILEQETWANDQAMAQAVVEEIEDEMIKEGIDE
ncbi:MAG: hypothetical protein ACFFER_05285 [Candidatus Thorarchaeota archaeon]